MSNIKDSILKLEKHQQEAYDSVEELFNKKGKAAVIFPTGCGKSFVTLEYILHHPDDRILFLSPRNAIKDQMYEYIIRFIGGDQRPIEEIIHENGNLGSESLKRAAKQYIPNIECMLYQTISKYGEKDSVDDVISKLKPDLIVVDEMHHLKTKSMKDAAKLSVINDDIEEIDNDIFDDEVEDFEETQVGQVRNNEDTESQNKWGKSFKKFLSDNPQAKLLGLTATPIRMDSANVVERMFDDAVAKEISLLEAMEEGIIYPPKYIVPDFIREDELKTLLEKISQAEGERKEELKAKYDELVKKSSEAPGIPELLDEHIEERTGKYIIFCKDIEDMKEKMSKAKEWFGKIDENPEVYGISSKDSTSNEQLKAFNSSTSDKLKLMYCVGMIDEGVHLNNISGVILAAKTGSRPTYLQRLGRAISSGKDKKQALVIDLVNNNEILRNDLNIQYGYEVNDLEALQKLVDWIDEHNDGKLPVYSEDVTTREQIMARRLARINNKYLKYVQNEELLEILDEEKYDEIFEIIELGKTVGMFEDVIQINIPGGDGLNVGIDLFLENIEIKGVRREFRDLLKDRRNVAQEFIEICRALKSIGIDCSKMSATDTIESICKKQGIDIGLAIDVGIDIDKKIGNIKRTLSKASRGIGESRPATAEQEQILKEEFGITFEIKERNVVQEFIETCRALKSIGIDCSKMSNTDTIESICKKQGIDIGLAIDVGIDIDKKIGGIKARLNQASRGKGENRPATAEQEQILKEEFGITFEIKERNVAQEFIETCRALKSIGIVCSKMSGTDTIESICKKQGIDIGAAIQEGLEIDKKIGKTKVLLSCASRGKVSIRPSTAEQEQILKEEFGITFEIKERNVAQEFIETCRALKSIGIDCSKMSNTDTIESICKKQGIDIGAAIQEGLEIDKKIGGTKSRLNQASRGKGKTRPATVEQKQILKEEFGITFDKKRGKSPKQLGKTVAKGVVIEEVQQAEQFLDLITKEKQIEGDEHIDQSGD